LNLGLTFTANSTFLVDALGIFNQTVLTGSEQVGLYNSSGNLLTSTTVTLSDPQVNGYLFQSITPVTLTAGHTYTVVANTGNNPWAYGSTAPNQASYVTYNSHAYLYTSSLAFPTLTASEAGGPSGAYYGPNFEIAATTDPVPEPGGFGPLAALAALAGYLYHRKIRRVTRMQRSTAQV